MPEYAPPLLVGAAIAALSGFVWLILWIGKMIEHRSTVVTFMEEARADLKRIFGILSESSTVGRGSPLRLTELGLKVSEEIEATAWAQRVGANLSARVEGKSPGEIQEFCFSYLLENPPARGGSMDRSVTESAYRHGIDRQLVLDVLVIELRDVLLGNSEPTRLRPGQPGKARAHPQTADEPASLRPSVHGRSNRPTARRPAKDGGIRRIPELRPVHAGRGGVLQLPRPHGAVDAGGAHQGRPRLQRHPARAPDRLRLRALLRHVRHSHRPARGHPLTGDDPLGLHGPVERDDGPVRTRAELPAHAARARGRRGGRSGLRAVEPQPADGLRADGEAGAGARHLPDRRRRRHHGGTDRRGLARGHVRMAGPPSSSSASPASCSRSPPSSP